MPPALPNRLRDGDALLVVDVQNDFTPGGALGVPDGDAVIPVLNEWIAAAREANVPIYASRDWHPADHVSFESRGGPWPAHCVQDTPGAQFHSDLDLKEDVIVLSKGDHPDLEAYSAFDQTELGRAASGGGRQAALDRRPGAGLLRARQRARRRQGGLRGARDPAGYAGDR